MTAKIQAIGKASSLVIWQFSKDKKPLVGEVGNGSRQSLVQTVVVPSGTATLEYKLQGFAVIDCRRYFGLVGRPIRVETPVIDAEITLL